MSLIATYFPDLSPGLLEKFSRMEELYREWNSRINVVSRKDIDEIGLHHILHSLAVAKFTSFSPGTEILDAGTGGGFPGLPLAILFPQVRFTLVDSIAKKIKVVEAISRSLDLENVTTLNGRFEQVKKKVDFVTGRAVSNLPLFLSMTGHCIKKEGFNSIPNGILYLTGGEIIPDLQKISARWTIRDLSGYFSEAYFATKKIVHLYNF